jgi:hypothetical protein
MSDFNSIDLPYTMSIYDKENMSKIQMAIKDDVSLVKVCNNEYYVYTYRSKLNVIKNSMINLFWHKEALFKEGCLKFYNFIYVSHYR